ncbi:MAG: hypothetical protein WBR31_19745, partial [Candidatus Sulfotelmatobacter sp.]
MLHRLKAKSPGRDQRHSAAWGKRLGLLLVLIAGTAFAQNPGADGRFVGKFAPDLAPIAARAHVAAARETVQV